MLSTTYFNTVTHMLNQLAQTQQPTIEKAAATIARSLRDDGMLHVFGSGHSTMIGKEITGRAGGLVPVNLIPDPTDGMAERLEGLGQILLDRYDRAYEIRAGEVLIVVSTSGRNPVPIDLALAAKERGLYTIAITSVEYSRQSSSRHSSGKRLFEVVDLVLDNGVPVGDAVVHVEQLEIKAGPVSTMAGALLANMLMLTVIEQMLAMGEKPPVLKSLNVDGADDHNDAMMKPYKHRLVY